MKKFFPFLLLLLIGCKSVDNWTQTPVLSQNTIDSAKEYILLQEEYNKLINQRNILDVADNVSIEELNLKLESEKQIAVSSQFVLNSWFDFYLNLRQDKGYIDARKGHYYFRKAIKTLDYSDVQRNKHLGSSVKDSKNYNNITLLEAEIRLAIGEIVVYNNTGLDVDQLYKDLKKIYKSMD